MVGRWARLAFASSSLNMFELQPKPYHPSRRNGLRRTPIDIPLVFSLSRPVWAR